MKQLTMGVAAVAAITLTAFIPVAHADPYTDNDVSAYAATAADAVCRTVNANPTVAGVQAAIDLVHQSSGFSLLHSATIVNLGVRGKCMQQFPLLTQWANTPAGTQGVTNYDAPGAPDTSN
jgi:hypothetical protein